MVDDVYKIWTAQGAASYYFENPLVFIDAIRQGRDLAHLSADELRLAGLELMIERQRFWKADISLGVGMPGLLLCPAAMGSLRDELSECGHFTELEPFDGETLHAYFPHIGDYLDAERSVPFAKFRGKVVMWRHERFCFNGSPAPLVFRTLDAPTRVFCNQRFVSILQGIASNGLCPQPTWPTSLES